MTSLFRLLSQRKTNKSNEELQLLPAGRTNTRKKSASKLSLRNTKKINDLLLICEEKILTEMKTKLLEDMQAIMDKVSRVLVYGDTGVKLYNNHKNHLL